MPCVRLPTHMMNVADGPCDVRLSNEACHSFLTLVLEEQRVAHTRILRAASCLGSCLYLPVVNTAACTKS